MQPSELVGLMEGAVALAAETRPHPNPRVGAVVLDTGGRVVAAAAHQGPGMAHAEAAALEDAGAAARGGTLVITLEPCTHWGRTPPCVDAIIAAGVEHVAVAMVDPDDRVSGRGIEALRAAGLVVSIGVGTEAAAALDPGYLHHRRTGMPLVMIKSAMTIDGQVAAADGSSQWITSGAARDDAHAVRAGVDAVVVGAGTVRADDPRLTVRLEGFDGPQPTPVVVAGTEPIEPGAAVFAGKALVYSPVPRQLPAEVVVLPGEGGAVDLAAMLADLAGRGHLDVLVEGGPTLAGAMWRAGLARRGITYVGALVGGGDGAAPLAGPFPSIDTAAQVAITAVHRLGGDVRIDYEVPS